MTYDKVAEYRVNARKTDAFDIFNIQEYLGPNPYLNTGAVVFDFRLTGNTEPLSIETYVAELSYRYPTLREQSLASYAELIAQTLLEVNRLDIALPLDRVAIHLRPDCARIAIQALHQRTTREAVYFVWDWLEAITDDQRFAYGDRMDELQQMFRRSVYGGPTVNALLANARQKGIPTFHLWDEGLMQYGFGKNHVRGTATTFDRDSHLDSDFTTRKDDCKAFLSTLGFPVPKGRIVENVDEAVFAARMIGYPVAIKPVVGHKGIGVTANVQDDETAEFAFEQAVRAIPEGTRPDVIVEQSITGSDFRLLCVDGKFVAATERRPPYVTGDGDSTIAELIDRENATDVRRDTPMSPLGKIIIDAALENYLKEQGRTLDTIPAPDETIYLRKVANLSSGGVSIDATATIHVDNKVLAQDIASHFRLTCLGIDVIAEDLTKSWKDSSFAIIEINSAPGIFMHLRPAIGESVDVPGKILETFFAPGETGRIPIIAFNHIAIADLQEVIDHILSLHPDWQIGAVCQEGVFLNRSAKSIHKDYNTNVQNLLRHPRLDLLIVEYDEDVLESDGMFCEGSNLVVLDDPTETERMLQRDALPDATIIVKQGVEIAIHSKGLIEQYTLGDAEPFKRVYLKEVSKIL